MDTTEITYFECLLKGILSSLPTIQRGANGHGTSQVDELRNALGQCPMIEAVVARIFDVYHAPAQPDHSTDTEIAPLLHPILQRIDIGKGHPPGEPHYLLPMHLNDAEMYPVSVTALDARRLAKERSVLWESFLRGIANLRHVTTPRVYFRALLNLVEQFFTSIPSTNPWLPLYDVVRMDTAISFASTVGDTGRECLLVKGDLSGIQNFIYEGISNTANPAKTLRGKSFYLAVLAGILSRELMFRCNAFEASIIFRGGGHVLLLLPNTQHTRDALDQAVDDINTGLLDLHGARLQFVIGSAQASVGDAREHFDTLLSQVNAGVALTKRKKLHGVLDRIMSAPLPLHNASELDQTDFAALGEIIPRTTWYALHRRGTDAPLSGTMSIAIPGTAFAVIFTATHSIKQFASAMPTDSDVEVVHYIAKQEEFSPEEFPEMNWSDCTDFTGAYVPTDTDDYILSFDEISAMNTENYPGLGFARMDVDSLGSVFAHGIRPALDNASDAAVATAAVSRAMNRFFSHEILTCARTHGTYIVYAGGDDLFAVASWKNILDFVCDVQTRFTRYSCGNPNLTISCGVFFGGSHTPIQRAAITAGEAEDQAKNVDPFMKGRVTLLERTVTWRELQGLLHFAGQLLDALREGGDRVVSRTFVHSVLALTQQCFDDRGAIRPGSIARLAYKFARRKIGRKVLDEEHRDPQQLLDSAVRIERERMGIMFAKYMLASNTESRAGRWKTFVIPATHVLWSTRDTMYQDNRSDGYE